MKYSYAILGGTGHVGSALSAQLLKEQQNILVIGHNQEKAQYWIDKGVAFETADVLDTDRLNALFSQAARLFILNPPADPSKDAEAEELKQVASIIAALDGLKPEKIVAASTYGARAGSGIFDLGTCYQLEQGLKEHGSPLAIIRSAYYMSNLDMPAQMAMDSGQFTTLLPADFKLPMVAPQDIGHFAAELIQNDETGMFYIQAKEEYSANDAVNILSELVNKKIEANEIPENKWATYMQDAGFSMESTQSFIGMTKLTINEKFEAEDPKIGEVTLRGYLEGVVGG